MRHGSLFSGIGGFDLAAEWMGWENIFHCEWNPFGQKVLNHYWPNAESFTDITKSDFTKYANTIDILTGGFPCQPYSLAGKRKGKEDERHLWPEMLRAIREIQPRWVLGENVFGLVNWSGGLVFHEVQADLEAEGYEVFPYVLPACAKNAPHRRDRIWFVAYSNSNGGQENTKRGHKENGVHGQEYERPHISETTTNADNRQRKYEEEQVQTRGNIINDSDIRNASNSSNQGLQRGEINGGTTGIRQERNEQLAGLLPSNWQDFPTQSPLCNGNDGLSRRLDVDTISFSKWRNESIKAGGNAIVPQVAYELFKAIQSYENL